MDDGKRRARRVRTPSEGGEVCIVRRCEDFVFEHGAKGGKSAAAESMALSFCTNTQACLGGNRMKRTTNRLAIHVLMSLTGSSCIIVLSKRTFSDTCSSLQLFVVIN